MEEEKRCPFCDELIRSSAIKCRYCGSAIIDKSHQKDLNLKAGIFKALDTKYEIIEEVGKGGMAKVYKAIHRNLNRVIALKIIHQNLIHDEETVLRFRREAQLGASLLHPNIVMVFDEGRINDIIYMSLEFLEGDDLHKIIKKKGKLTLQETIDIIAPTAEALDYVHRRNLVHRDVKSSNIFLANGNRPVLTDFGIAYARESESNLTRAGEVIGTPEFMSPEQASGVKVDGRSDLFSLGIVIYQCLTGKVPFKGDSHLSTIFQITRDPVPNILSLNSELPEWIVPVLEKCLEKEPENRIQTGAELAQMLRNSNDSKIIIPVQAEEFKKSPITHESIDYVAFKDNDIEEIIEAAEELFDNNKYKPAKEQYEKALQIRPDDQYVIGKIDHLNKILETIKKAEEEKLLIQEKYDLAISNGDSLFKEKKYNEASIEYFVARSLKRFEKYPKKQISEIEEILNQIKIEEDKKTQEKKYKEKISEAENLIQKQKFADAKSVLFSAIEIKPDDTLSKIKIEEINSKIARLQKEKEEREAIEKAFYSELSNAGDLLKSGEFEKALNSYQKARQLKPDEDYVANKIAELEDKIEQIRIAEEEHLAIEKAFQEELTLANDLFSADDFENALLSYNKAATIKPDDEYALEKILLVEDKIEQIKIAEQERIAIEKAFREELINADDLFSSGDIEKALDSYKKVSTIKPDDVTILDKIKLVEDKIEQVRLAEQERISIEKAFLEKLAIADDLFSSGNYEKALDSYKKASAIKPDDIAVLDKTKQVEDKIEQIRHAEQERISIERSFLKELATADNLFYSGDYEKASDTYNKALAIKPDDNTVLDKIKRVEDKIEQVRAAEQERLTQIALNEKEKKDLNTKYQNLIIKGDELYNQSLFQDSIEQYKLGLKIKPEEKYPISRIELIDEKIKSINLLKKEKEQKKQAYKKAIEKAENYLFKKRYEEAKISFELANSIDNDSEYPINKIKEIDLILEKISEELETKASLEKEYNELINKANVLQKDGSFSNAIELLNKAAILKPEAKFPTEKIEAIKLTIEIQKKAKEEQALNNKIFQSAITKAEKLFDEDKFLEAKSTFEIALTVQPNNEIIKAKIELAEEKIKNETKEKDEALLKEKEYNQLVAIAHQAFVEKQYEDCLKLYQDALNLKPADDFLKRQIKIIQGTIAEIRKNEQENIAIEKTLKSTISSAHSLRKNNKYVEAKTAFGIALSIKPDDKEIIKALAEIDEKISIQKQNEENQKSEKELYKNTLERASNFYKKEKLSEALKEFKKAAELQPKENYPKDRITEINNIIKGKNKADEEKKIKKELIVKAIQLSDKQTKQKQYNDARASLEEVKILDTDNKEIANKIDKIDELIEKDNTSKESSHTAESPHLPDQIIEDKTISLKIDQVDTITRSEESDRKVPEPEQKNDADIHYSTAPRKPKSKKSLKPVFAIAAVAILIVVAGSIYIMNSQTVTNKIPAASDIKTEEKKGHTKSPQPEVKKVQVNDPVTTDFDRLVSSAEECEKVGNLKKTAEAIDLYNQALAIKEDAQIKSKVAKLNEHLAELKFKENLNLALEKETLNTLNSTYEAIALYKLALEIKADDKVATTIIKLGNKIKDYNTIISVANEEYNAIANVEIENRSDKQRISLDLYQKSMKIFTPDNLIKQRIKELEMALK